MLRPQPSGAVPTGPDIATLSDAFEAAVRNADRLTLKSVTFRDANLAKPAAWKLMEDFAPRAAILDPETYGNKTQLGVSGGLILAAGSLADLAAQAAQLHTNQAGRVTQGAPDALPSPNNVSCAKVDDTLQYVSEPGNVA